MTLLWEKSMNHLQNAKLRSFFFFSSSQIAFSVSSFSIWPYCTFSLELYHPVTAVWPLAICKPVREWAGHPPWMSLQAPPEQSALHAAGGMLTRNTKYLLQLRLGEPWPLQMQGVKKLFPVTLGEDDHLANQLAPVSTLTHGIAAACCIPAVGPETQYQDRRKHHI